MQCVLCDGLESLFNVDGLLCGRLKVGDVAFGLAPGHRAFLGYLPLVLFHIDLVAQYNEGEVLGVPGASLNEELVSPAVQGLERLGAVDVVNEDAAVRTAVERDTEGLESFLTSGVPQLSITGNISSLHLMTFRAIDEDEIRTCIVTNRSSTMTSFVKLESDLERMSPAEMRRSARDEQVGSDGRLVLVAEPLVHILVHERGLSDTNFEVSVSVGARRGGGGGWTNPLSPKIIT